MTTPFGIRWSPGAVDLTSPPHVALDVPYALLFCAVAIGTAIAARRRPSLGIAILIATVPFALARYVGPTTLTLSKAALVGMAAGLALRGFDLAPLRSRTLRWLLGAFVLQIVAVAASAVAAHDRAAVTRELGKTCEYILTFVVTVVAYASDPDDRPIWRSLTWTSIVVCLGALAQYLVGAHSGIVIGGHAVPRTAGALEGPNQFGGFLEIVVPLLLARLLLHRDALLAFALLLGAISLVTTFSRGGIAGTLIALVVVLLATRIRPAVGAAVAVSALAVIGAIGVAVSRAGAPARYFSLDATPDPSTHLGNRSQLWSAAIALFRRSPLIGIGAGNYETALAFVGLTGVRTHANSLYLQSLAETGLLGLTATIAIFVAATVTLARSPLRRPVVVGALAATIALAAHQIFDDLFFFPKVATMYWLVLGVATAEAAAQRAFAERLLGQRARAA